MSYTIADEIKEYWDEFVDSSYLPGGMSASEIRNARETLYTVEPANDN